MGRFFFRMNPGSDNIAVRGLQLDIGALSGQRANLTFRMGSLASQLTVLFQEQVGSLTRLKGLGKPGVQDFPRRSVIRSIVFSRFAKPQTRGHFDVRGRHSGHRRQLRKW